MLTNVSHLRRAAVCAVLSLLVSAPAMGSKNEHREHGAHDHGHGVLEIAMDGGDLVMELRIPAVNVVGFEHAANSDEQRRAVNEAIERFSKGSALFTPSKAAQCELRDARVRLAGMEGGEEKHHEKHADKHGHGAEARHGEEAHSEMHAEYHFYCHSPKKLTVVEVAVFDRLIDVEAIDAHVVTAGHQGLVTLTPKQTVVKVAH